MTGFSWREFIGDKMWFVIKAALAISILAFFVADFNLHPLLRWTIFEKISGRCN